MMATHPPIQFGSKVCIHCRRERPVQDFYPHRTMADGRLNKCKDCTTADANAWRTINRAHWNSTRHKKIACRKHGLTSEQYDALYSDPRCAGCGTTGAERRLAIDHCHRSHGIRGLLCAQCNLALGNAKDDPATLRRLATYLDGALF